MRGPLSLLGDLFDSRDHRHLVWDLFDPAFDQFHHGGLRTLPRLWVPQQWGRGGTLLGIKMILSLTIKPFYFKPGPCSPFFCECTHGEIRIKKALPCVLPKVKHAFFILEWNNLSFYIELHKWKGISLSKNVQECLLCWNVTTVSFSMAFTVTGVSTTATSAKANVTPVLNKKLLNNFRIHNG